MRRIHSNPLGLILLALALAWAQPVTAGTFSLYSSPSSPESTFTESDSTVYNDTSKVDSSLTYDIIFDKFVLDNPNNKGTGFEPDELLFSTNAVTIPGSDVFATEFTAVPEPSAYMGIIFAILIGFFVRQHWLTMKREAAAFAAQKD